MDKNVEWTESALTDLENIAQYIAKDSVNYASVVVEKIRDASSQLTKFSEGHPMVAEFGNSQIRETYVYNFCLIFLVADDSVYVLGVIHGARNLDPLWDWAERRAESDDENLETKK